MRITFEEAEGPAVVGRISFRRRTKGYYDFSKGLVINVSASSGARSCFLLLPGQEYWVDHYGARNFSLLLQLSLLEGTCKQG